MRTAHQSAWLAAGLDACTLAFDLLMTQIEAGAFSPVTPIAPAPRREPSDDDMIGTIRRYEWGE
jgi:hypothetical protein